MIAASSRRTAKDSAYDDLLDPADDAGRGNGDDDDFMYKKIVGLDPENKTGRLQPELLNEPKQPRRVVVEFKEAGKLGVSFDREDADLRVVEVAETGLAAEDGSIRPGMQLHAVESAALGGPICVTGLGYTAALGTVAKAGRPMTLTFLCDELSEDEDDEEDGDDGEGSDDDGSGSWEEREVLHDGTGRPSEAIKAGKKANKKAVKEVCAIAPVVAFRASLPPSPVCVSVPPVRLCDAHVICCCVAGKQAQAYGQGTEEGQEAEEQDVQEALTARSAWYIVLNRIEFCIANRSVNRV